MEYSYRFFSWQFEFIAVPQLHDQLWRSAELREQALCTVDLFGVAVQALKDFSLIDGSEPPETYAFTRGDGCKPLKYAAYLKFMRQQLQLLAGVAQAMEV